MIGFLRVLLIAVPMTIYIGTRIVWTARRQKPGWREKCEDLARVWAGSLLFAASVRVDMVGAEVIDPDRPQILVANHVSWYDVAALVTHLPGKYRFVAKKELEKVPFFGPAWLACGHISIDRQDRSSAIQSLAEARRRIEEDAPTVVLFPEGTRSTTGELRPFKKGAFVLAIQTGVEVVPAAILGSREIMAKGSWRIRTGRTITIRFGTPIPVEGLELKDRDGLMERTRAAMIELLESKA